MTRWRASLVAAVLFGLLIGVFSSSMFVAMPQAQVDARAGRWSLQQITDPTGIGSGTYLLDTATGQLWIVALDEAGAGAMVLLQIDREGTFRERARRMAAPSAPPR